MVLPDVFLRLPLAHRALHDGGRAAPENGPTAIRRAIAAGYGIEVDVQLSSDGCAMVFHDGTLDRLTEESGPVTGRTAAELGRMRLAGGDDTIPTLAEILAMIDGRVPLLIEIKDQSGALVAGPEGLERAVAEALAGYEGPVAVMSFNPESIAAFADLAPDVPRGLVTDPFDASDWPDVAPDRRAHLRAIADFDRLGAAFISHNRADLAARPVAALKARGVPVLCWTVRSPAQEAEARKIADNITFEGYLAPLDPPR